jgi:hypothetical protein
MTVYAELLAQAKTFKASDPLGQFLTSEITKGVDPVSSQLAVNTVHDISQDLFSFDHTGGDFTLTFNLRSGETFTTAAVAFNAVAATIETAIDSAATTASIVGWTNGDITVSGTDLQTTDITMTFDGASVAGLAHGATTMVDSRTGGTSGVPAVAQTTRGQSTRPAWGLLIALGVITSSIPEQDAATSVTSVTAGGDLTRVPTPVILAAAAEAAAEDDNNGSYFSIVEGLSYHGNRANQVETRVGVDNL